MADGTADDVIAEAARRRTFAIISHPDAGKTTLTEKFLLYGGAVQQAGAVKARAITQEVLADVRQATGVGPRTRVPSA